LEVPFEGSVGALAADRSRFVAVGSVAGHGSSSWTSSDGITWERQEVPNKSFGEIAPGVDLTAGMGRLIRLGDTLYSFGGAEFNDAVLLAGWRWTDGGAWEVIDSRSGFFEGRVTALTASDEALLAGKISFAGGLRGTYSTWLWTADTSWVETGLASSDDEDILVQDLTWNAGSYIAVGDRAERQADSEPWEWPRTPAIWKSPDGRDWTAIRPPAGMSSLCTVAALPMGGFVALGSAGERPASWTSPDGNEWIEGTVQPPTAPTPRPRITTTTACRVLALDGGLITMVGATLIWTSIDGRSWAFGERLDISGVATSNIAALGDHVLLFGTRVDPKAEGGYRYVLLRGTAGS
jgi:hypothetical protein